MALSEDVVLILPCNCVRDLDIAMANENDETVDQH